MGTRVTLAFAALICGQFSSISGSKASHAVVEHPLLHPAVAHHPAAAHHPSVAHHPALHPAVAHHSEQHPKAVLHPAQHPKAVLHPAQHPKAALHPTLHPKIVKHLTANPKVVEHLVSHPKLDKHPALHPKIVKHLLSQPKIVEHLVPHPKVTKLLNKGHPKIVLPHQIPDILDKASEAFAYGDSLLKRYIRDDAVKKPALANALQITVAIRKTLQYSNANTGVHGIYQRSLELLLDQLIEDLRTVLNSNLAGFGDNKDAKNPLKVAAPHKTQTRPVHHWATHKITPKEYIPVMWEAVPPHKVIKHIVASHPKLVSHPHLASHPKVVSHPLLVSHPKLAVHPKEINHLKLASHPKPQHVI